MYFKYLLKSIEFVSYSYYIFFANISIGKWGPFITCSFECSKLWVSPNHCVFWFVVDICDDLVIYVFYTIF